MKLIKKVLLSGLTACVLAFGSAQAADKTFNMKFQSSDNTGNQNFELKKEWANRVNQMSDGRLNIEIMSVNSVVKHTETLDAIRSGILDGHITATATFQGKNTSIPASIPCPWWKSR